MLFPVRDDNPRSTFPWVTLGLLVVNTLVQLYQATMSPERAAVFIRATGVIPLEISSLTDLVRFPDHPAAVLPVPLTLFSALFVHGGWMHLLSNMWYLWLFGDNVEDKTGHLRFLLFYLLAGIGAGLLHVAMHPASPVPMVGASGAIAGVLGAYLLLFPHARVHCLLFVVVVIRLVAVPAVLVLGLWFVLQLLWGLLEGSVSGVAWFAHLGGFVCGLLLIRLFTRRRGAR